MKHSIAIFASGSGSNAENIVKYFGGNEFGEVNLIITNNPNAYVIDRAKKLKVPHLVFGNKSDYSGDDLKDALDKYGIDFIVLAGFMWLVPPQLINAYPNRMVNIHPALLPLYGGKGFYGDKVHKAVSEAGEKKTGITIHYVNERYDEGDIIFQADCEILPGENPDTIAQKVHALEYEHYPRVIEEVLKKIQ